MLNITTKLIPVNTLRRSGLKLSGPKFLVAHDTGNDGTTANGNASYFINSANELSASAHYFVDDKEIICVIPENEKAWHVQYGSPKDNAMYGADANDSALGIELCFHSLNIRINNQKAYANYVELFATLCIKYNLSPASQIVGHETLDPSRRSDPSNALKYVGKTFQGFLLDVSKRVDALKPPVSPVPLQQSKLGAVGDNVTRIQSALTKASCAIAPLQAGLYDVNMAKCLLYFQLKNAVSDIAELAFLRGETCGPKTVAALSNFNK